MRSARLLLFFTAVAISFLSGAMIASQATAHAVNPDRLEILRTVGHGPTPAREMVTQARSVQDLYHVMLSLPVAPVDEICPQYIIASYQLTFYAHNAVVQKANALRGLCQPVTLGKNDVRIANAKFWLLMSNAMGAGKSVSMVVATPTCTAAGTAGLHVTEYK
jgi:hypothetical protein